MEKNLTSGKRILVEMEERILKYVIKSKKVERFERKFRSSRRSTFENELCES